MVHEMPRVSAIEDNFEAGPEKTREYHGSYVNAEMIPICEIHAEFRFDQETGMEELTRLVLRNDKGEDVDALEILGLPQGTRILVHEGNTPTYHSASRVIHMNGITTPLQFVVLAHEIGHAAQDRETSYNMLLSWYGLNENLQEDVFPLNPLKAEALEVIQKYAPDHGVDLPGIDKLIEVGKRYIVLREESEKVADEYTREYKRLSDVVFAFFRGMVQQYSPNIRADEFLDMCNMHIVQRNDDIASQILPKDSDALLPKIFETIKNGSLNVADCVVTMESDGSFVIEMKMNNEGEEVSVSFSLKLGASGNHLERRAVKIRNGIFDMQQRQEALTKEVNDVAGEYGELAAPHENALRLILRIPTVILERDATRRALVGLRTLKQQYRIDFTQEVSGALKTGSGVKESSLTNSANVSHREDRSISGDRTDAVGHLNACLGTYSANNAWNRYLYDKSPRAKDSASQV